MTAQQGLPVQESPAFGEAPRVLSPADVTLIRTGWAVLSTIGVGAVAIGVLAFQPWVDFGTFETDGTDVKALTGWSDGYFVALLAAAILASVAGILTRPRWTLALLPFIGLCSIVVMTTAAYSIVTDWHAAGVDSSGAFVQEGDPTAVPYLISAIAIAVGVLAALLAAVRASRTR